MFSIISPNRDLPNTADELDENLAEETFDSAEEMTSEENSSEDDLAHHPRVPLKPTIISEGFEFVGTITSNGAVHIAGLVKGKITANSVLIEAEGEVDGEMMTDRLMVKGSARGDIHCKELNIGPRAVVDGIVSYQNMHIQRGGQISGTFKKN